MLLISPVCIVNYLFYGIYKILANHNAINCEPRLSATFYKLHRVDDISLYIEVINQHKALVYSMKFIKEVIIWHVVKEEAERKNNL